VTNDQRLETRAVTRLLSATEDLLRRKVDTAGNLLHPDLLALVLAAIRQFSFDPRYREKLIPVMQESLQLVEAFPDSQSKAFVYMLTCYVPTLQFHELLELCQNTIGIYTRLGDDWGLALAQVILADLLVFNGKDLDLARRYYQSSLETFNRLGNIWGQALCYMGLNYVEGKAGNAQEAYRLGCHGVDLFTRLENYERALKINHYLGDLAAGMGDLTAARRHYAANLAHVSRIGDDYMVEFYTDILKELSPGDKTIRSSSA